MLKYTLFHTSCFIVSLFTCAQTAGTITYDDFTQMPIEIKFDASNYVQYIYDGDGKRIRKIRHLSDQNNNLYIDTTLYIYGTHGLPLSEKVTGTISQNGVITPLNREKLHIYGHEYGSLAMEETNQQQQLDYFIRDHQSSLRVALKSTDNSTSATITYDSYGKEISRTTDVGFNQRFSHTYTGQEYDVESQTFNFRRRLYSPKEKRFLQPDPKHQYYSPYAYVGNNPINLIDRTGTVGESILNIKGYTDAPMPGVGNNSRLFKTNYDQIVNSNRLPPAIHSSSPASVKQVNLGIHAGNVPRVKGRIYGSTEYAEKAYSITEVGENLGNYFDRVGIEPKCLSVNACYGGGRKNIAALKKGIVNSNYRGEEFRIIGPKYTYANNGGEISIGQRLHLSQEESERFLQKGKVPLRGKRFFRSVSSRENLFTRFRKRLTQLF